MKKKTAIGFKTKAAEGKEPELESEELELEEDPRELEHIMEGEEYQFEAAVAGNLKKMKFLVLTQLGQAPLSIRSKMLSDYSTALITAYKLKNEKQ